VKKISEKNLSYISDSKVFGRKKLFSEFFFHRSIGN